MDRRAARCIGLLMQHASSPVVGRGMGELPRHLGSLARSHAVSPASRSGPLQDFLRASQSQNIRRVVRASSAMPARQETSPGLELRLQGPPKINIGIDGAISLVCDESVLNAPTVYENKDGHRVEDGRYAAFAAEISSFVPAERQFTDPVRTFAYGTDASFYRLNPKLVVKVHSEEDIARILPIAAKHGVPVTFRAAGTSLSGQAITDSVLLKLSHVGKNFRKYTVHGDGSEITVEPGLIGGEVNKILANHAKKGNHPIQYKIGPDPSSIDSCMMGGIVSNNSSGMCCGVAQNTYHTLKDMRVVLPDGTVLDTSNAESRAAFLVSHADLITGVLDLAQRIRANPELAALIKRKFAIKCTTGYSLNALVDFPLDDPIEIIKRLMIGSEGTLGFVSQATYNTVPEWPHKKSAFVMFPDIHSACAAASALRDNTQVDAVEMFDRTALKECEVDEDLMRLVPCMQGAGPSAASLLIECRGRSPEVLQENIDQVYDTLRKTKLPFGAHVGEAMPLERYSFRDDPKESKVFWDVRKGLIPIVGGGREPGTSFLIEDVACPVHRLADMTVDLAAMFQKYGYTDASCFGHALEGNLHLVFSQGFRTPEEVQRFSNMMDEMCYIVATVHGGSLKGEHGTGRNIAPYVEMEWGTTAYELMWELKELFDPEYILNPGVILNKDPNVHLKNLKPAPISSPLVDSCIECGFCESNCPSRSVSLTPRQRITSYREMSRLKQIENPTAEQAKRLATFSEIYAYQGEGTCAADGMCQEKCPVKINTGSLIKSIRAEQMKDMKAASSGAMTLANNFGTFTSIVPPFLNLVDFAHRLVGPKPLEFLSGTLNRGSNHIVPAWNEYMPKGASKLNMTPVKPAPAPGLPRQVVYMPSCVTRMMGPASGDSETGSVHDKLLSLFEKAGYEVIYPEGLKSSCCGMLFDSRGFKDAAEVKGAELEASLLAASQGGKIPIVCDTSPCLSQIKNGLSDGKLKFSLYEPVEFVRHFMLDKLEWTKVRDSVAVHVPCSSKKMGLADAFTQVASLCAHEVTHTGIPCCGMAGDRGMRYPELTAGATQELALPSNCTDGYSTSRTCEMALSNASGLNFRGLVYLIDEATKPKKVATQHATA